MSNHTSKIDNEPDDNLGDQEAKYRALAARMRALREQDRTSRTSGAEPNIAPPNLRNRRVPSVGARIDPSAIVMNGSALNTTTVNIAASVNVWGRSIHRGISNAVKWAKDTFENAIKRFKNADVKELLKAMVELARRKSKEVTQWCKDNPWKAAYIVIAVLTTIVFGAAAPAMLSAVGFSAAGPVAGM